MKRRFRVFGLITAVAMAITACTAVAAQAAEFESETATTYLQGEQTTENVFTTGAGKVKCKKGVFTGESKAKKVATISVGPAYSECTAFGSAATWTTNGCTITLTASSTTAGNTVIDCPVGKVMEIDVPSGNCSITIKAQTAGKNGVAYMNTGGAGTTMDILMTWVVTEIHIFIHGPGMICGTPGTYSGVLGASLSGSVTFRAYSDPPHTKQVGLTVIP